MNNNEFNKHKMNFQSWAYSLQIDAIAYTHDGINIIINIITTTRVVGYCQLLQGYYLVLLEETSNTSGQLADTCLFLFHHSLQVQAYIVNYE